MRVLAWWAAAVASWLVACEDSPGRGDAADSADSGAVETTADDADDGAAEVAEAVADGADGAEPEVATDADVPGGDGETLLGGGETTASAGFPGHELVLAILEPGADWTGVATGAVVRVSGILFTDAPLSAVSIVWQLGATSGAITPAKFWQSGPINLIPGNNRLTVTVSDGARSASDTVVVTYNPAFRFDTSLAARPETLWVGEATEVVVTIGKGRDATADPSTLELLRVDAEGQTIAVQGAMRDDGGLATSGDEIQGDGVYSWVGELTCDTPGTLYFRASVHVGPAPGYDAFSPVFQVPCLARVPVADCGAHRALVASAGAALEGGASVDQVLADVRSDASVALAGPAPVSHPGSATEPAVWILFADGLLGAAIAPSPGTRGGGGAGAVALAAALGGTIRTAVPGAGLGSTRALVLSPFAEHFGADDEGADVTAALSGITCPRFAIEQDAALANGAASIARFRRASDYGVMSVATHGAALFAGVQSHALGKRFGWRHAGAQETLWTGSAVACESLLQAARPCEVTAAAPTGGCPSGTECLVTKGTASDTGASGKGMCVDETEVDLRMGRAVITNLGYAVTPAFFQRGPAHRFPGSFVHLGACRSMWNGTLAAALYAAGAALVTGFSDDVSSSWAHAQAVALFGLVASAGSLATFDASLSDPAHPTTQVRLFGATNLAFNRSDLLNGNFETGSTSGWRSTGDGRVVGQFGTASTVDGKFMGLVSTGLGYAVQTGSLEQTFCVPAGISRLEFYWAFYSEEFREWCGDDTYQDRFEAVLVGDDAIATPVVDVRIDDLCGYADGTCGACAAPVACDAACFAQAGCRLDAHGLCDGAFNCQCGRYYVGLEESEVDFDRGGAFKIQWQKTSVDVSRYAGKGPVTLRMSASDSGDSLFDTAVLIDAVKVE